MPSSNLSSGYVVFLSSVTVSCDSDTGVKTMGSNGNSLHILKLSRCYSVGSILYYACAIRNTNIFEKPSKHLTNLELYLPIRNKF